ncbi:MAG: hypothetical protein LBE74_07065 [Treponema sp.]|jgi:hypothetical protein|nr:hypothetical protein [Treponema sp.]
MKKTFLFMLAVILSFGMAFMSCSGDKDSSGSTGGSDIHEKPDGSLRWTAVEDSPFFESTTSSHSLRRG